MGFGKNKFAEFFIEARKAWLPPRPLKCMLAQWGTKLGEVLGSGAKQESFWADLEEPLN